MDNKKGRTLVELRPVVGGVPGKLRPAEDMLRSVVLWLRPPMGRLRQAEGMLRRAVRRLRLVMGMLRPAARRLRTAVRRLRSAARRLRPAARRLRTAARRLRTAARRLRPAARRLRTAARRLRLGARLLLVGWLQLAGVGWLRPVLGQLVGWLHYSDGIFLHAGNNTRVEESIDDHIQ